ncbi:alpha/beta hydrolase [Leifsonia sp. 1010]|uniref:alpha/beta hydrolase n=1 Tax=Leifsonia sp. 1010 TaxID=2817769 RepID=UPI00285D3471|nr:alpha/beta hydrolase [Leifsonia sp. 1010]MDR6613289.1 hypothetical protein [Leifsonia sp. 1010]
MVEALGTHLRTWSERLDRQAEVSRNVLDTRLGAASWSGLAADVFSDRLRSLTASASDAAARHAEGVAAVTRWSGSMGLAQSDADRALRDAEDALADLELAQESVAALGVEHAALLSALSALQKAYASTEKPPPGKSAPSAGDVSVARRREQEASADLTTARFAVEDAQERLEDAKRRARDAKREYDAAEKVFADALDAALHGALTTVAKPELQAFASMVGKLSKISPTASVNATLMDTLKSLTPQELATLVADDPQILQQFWQHPPSPDQVAKWWTGLDTKAQGAFEVAVPGVLGNLAGLPYAVRGRCNLTVYEQARSHPGALTPQQRKVLTALGDVLADPSASLVCFNLDASVPMVAVGYGDLDTSDTVTWAAPGMLSDAADATKGWSRSAKNLYTQQNLVDDRTHGVVAWLGYDTPDLVTVNNPAAAQNGSWRFAAELDGTYAARTAKPAYVSVVAHSYGTTMAADALTRTKHPVDSFTMLGSAGIDTQVVTSLSDLHVKQASGSAAIYTTAAELDYLAPFGSTVGGRAEPNPEAAFSPAAAAANAILIMPPKVMGGAQSFSSEGAVLPGGDVLEPTKGHSALGGTPDENDPNLMNGTAPVGHGYLDLKTESLHNAAYTTIGLPGEVVGGLRPTG